MNPLIDIVEINDEKCIPDTSTTVKARGPGFGEMQLAPP